MGWGKRARGNACIALFVLSLLGLSAALLSRGESASTARDDLYLHALDAFQRGQFDRALAILEPLDDDRSHRLAARAALALGQPLRAATHLRRVLELKPGDCQATMQLASAYVAAGMDELALVTYESAIRLKPDDAAAWKAAGILHARAGDASLAQVYLIRARELAPDDREIGSLIAELARPHREADRETLGGLGLGRGLSLPNAPNPLEGAMPGSPGPTRGRVRR
jgi:cytochrome c-type biogenesis protein CcmH/NrfG